MKKFVPQYLKDNMWIDMDFETGEIFQNSVTTQYCFEDYAKTALYYSFKIANRHSHEHDFTSVLKRCFDYPESFNLNNDDKDYYTKGQINFLEKLKKQCLEDGLKDISKNNKYNIKELKKRNYQNLINSIKENNN